MDLTVEILKRTAHLELPPLSDESLVLHAEELFLEMDQNPGFVAKSQRNSESRDSNHE